MEKKPPSLSECEAKALAISILLYFPLEMEENRQKTNKKAKQLRES